MTKSKFSGLGVVVVTPFLNNGDVDYRNLEQLVESLIVGGCDYLVLLGTNSETSTLTEEEKINIVKLVIHVNAGRLPLMLGLGGPSTQQVVEHLKNDDFTGIDAILSVTPYYNRPSQLGLYEHYREISYHSPLPVVMYNVPKRTGCCLETDTILQIARNCDNIIGIKEASGNMNHIMKLIKDKPDHFLVISGDDAITLPLLAVGVDGLISVTANAFPKMVSKMVHLAMNGDFENAKLIHNILLDITQLSLKEGNPAGIKAILALQGKMGYYLRQPLSRVSLELQQVLKEVVSFL
ncbi:MAG: 4-hydroxy-tetrahydrodipicolinate synthase [Bacteroidales bacterium]|jgi:4-hydroxy-tetrahydrodipicolinate synthase|nr:4-hydroxy-tetrahydrodipicolinate synthase [Bacteroidales bacterium]